MYSYGPPHMAVQKQDDQHEHTFSSYVRIQDVVLKTCLGRWTIGRSGERGSGISVLPARHDDDDDDNNKVVSFVSYLGQLLKWTREELQQIDQRTRKLMWYYGYHSIKYDTMLVTVPNMILCLSQYQIWYYACYSTKYDIMLVTVPNVKRATPWHYLKHQ